MTITHSFALKSFMDSLTSKQTHAIIGANKNESVSCTLKIAREKNHDPMTSYKQFHKKRLHVPTLVHTDRYNRMNDKRLSFTSVFFIHAITYLPYEHIFHTYLYDQTYKDTFAPACQLQQKILYKNKITEPPHIHTSQIHNHHKILHTNMI